MARAVPLMPPTSPVPDVTFRDALWVWLKIGVLGFGGPAGQIALMHRILVDEKRWLDEPRFLHALNYCMLLPGPEAQQLAVYSGWLLHGVRGGLAAGLLFVLPGALVIIGFALAYARFAELTVMQGLFVGIKAGVLALVVEAFVRIARRVLKDRFSGLLAGGAFIALFVFAVPFPFIILAAAIAGFFRRVAREPADVAAPANPAPRSEGWWLNSLFTLTLGLGCWLTPIVGLWSALGPHHILTQLAVFFAQVAIITFGGAYAVLTYVAQHVVQIQGWLSPGEMLDGLGLAETTPGPLILVLEFVGFLAAFKAHTGVNPYVMGMLGAGVVLWVTFAPCFLWIFLGAPYVERLRTNARVSAILSSITAAVGGVILNLSVWFAIHTLFAQTTPLTPLGIHLTVPQLASFAPVAGAITAASFVALFVLRWGTFGTLALASALGIMSLIIVG